MTVEINRSGPEEQHILANLLELYVHDFSEFHPVKPGPDGKFGYKHLSRYWTEPDHHPFVIRVDGRLAGFILVKRRPDAGDGETAWDVAEFFILRGYRRGGVGTEAAHRVWRRFPGAWQVRVMEENRSGRKFWQRAIAAFTGERAQPVQVQVGGERWRVFSFVSSSVA